MATRSKQKSLARKTNADKRPHAVAKYIRISPFKVRIVLDIIRGKNTTKRSLSSKILRKRLAPKFLKCLTARRQTPRTTSI